MKKERNKMNDYINDNIMENGIEDIIIDGQNISKILRKNRNKYLEVKEQRNYEAKRAEFYKNAFGIVLVILILILVWGLGYSKIKGMTEERMEQCQNQGYSYEYCVEENY